jgi:hypothetical protein
MSDDDYNFSITAVTTGRTIELPREYEDLLMLVIERMRELGWSRFTLSYKNGWWSAFFYKGGETAWGEGSDNVVTPALAVCQAALSAVGELVELTPTATVKQRRKRVKGTQGTQATQ